MNMKQKGLFLNIVVYTSAFILGFLNSLMIEDLLFSSLCFTLSATCVVFLVAFLLKDTSLYDPYWSVEPPVLLLLVMIRYGYMNLNSALLWVVFLIWSVRLTKNWYYTYKGVGKEDWRYHDFREKLPPALYFFLDLFGFQYMPTVVVFLGMLPAFFLIQEETFHPIQIVGYVIMLMGVVFEHLADSTVHTFIKDKKNRGKTCQDGIWKYSRHPNYLGELTFWFGLTIMYFLVMPNAWYYGLGSIGIDLVFICASIPLMENHNLKRRKDYPEYQRTTSVLFLLPKKSSKS